MLVRGCMPYVRSLLASMLLATVSVAAGPVPVAQAASATAAAEEMPEPAYAPLAAVAIMLETGQALLFDESSGKYRVVMVGELAGDWKVVAIEEDRVIVLHGDQRDELGLVPPPRPIEGVRLPHTVVRMSKNGPPPAEANPTPAPCTPCGPAAPAAVVVARTKPAPAPEDPSVPHKLSRQELNRELGDFDRLGAAVDVSLAEGGGFRLTRVEKSSWPYKMGLRQGDIIRSVAGERVANVEDAARVYARLRATRQFTIEVDRPMAGIVEVNDPPTTRIVLQYHVK